MQPYLTVLFALLGLFLLYWLITTPLRQRTINLRRRQFRERKLPSRLPPYRGAGPGPTGGKLLPSEFLLEYGYWKMWFYFLWLGFVIWIIWWGLSTGYPFTQKLHQLLLICVGIYYTVLQAVYGIGRWWIFRGMRAELSTEPLAPGDVAVLRIYGDHRSPTALGLRVTGSEITRQLWVRHIGDKETDFYKGPALAVPPVYGSAANGLLFEVPIAVPRDAQPSYEERDYKIRWTIMVAAPWRFRGVMFELYRFRVASTSATNTAVR